MLVCWMHFSSAFPSGSAVKKPPVMQAAVTQAPLRAQTLKGLPAMWETRVRAPGGEEPPEKEMAAHS